MASNPADQSTATRTDDASYNLPPPTNPFPASTDLTGETADADYGKALEASRKEFYEKLEKRNNQEKNDRQVRMILSLGNEFAPITAMHADTLIYIGPPPKSRGQSFEDYRYVERRFNILHRVSSQTLRDLNSSAFDRLLGPKSERTRRRFGKDGLLNGVVTVDIKYYIDLRPAEEGDEAVELITDLTCTRGILKWYKAEKKYSIAPTMICGRDDFVSPLDQFRENEAEKEQGGSEKIEPPTAPEAEYSALRHRSAIERVLQAIHHNDPKLDSAPKMWTFFQVAKHLDVAKHERISGWITKWLYSHPNSNFIQSNPEVVYRIGLGTMSVNLICDGFSMLAGEKALLDTSDPSLRLHLKTSVHGRPLEILDDDERNRVDHAAASLHARIKGKFQYLIDENMDWLKLSDEYSKIMLLHPRNDKEKDVISSTIMMIQNYVRGRVLYTMARNFKSDHAEFDQALGSCREFRDGLPLYFNDTYGNLSEVQRILTRTLWIALQTEKFEDGDANAWTPAKGPTGVLYHQRDDVPNVNHCPIGDEMIDRERQKPGTGLKTVSYKDLALKIYELDKISAKHYAEDRVAASPIAKEKLNHQEIPVLPGRQSSEKDSRSMSRIAQGKHELVEFDSDEEIMLGNGHTQRARSGSEKRQRLSIDDAAFVQKALSLCNGDAIQNHYLDVKLPVRLANPDNFIKDVAGSKAGDDTSGVVQSEHLTFWQKAKRGDYGSAAKKSIQKNESTARSAQEASVSSHQDGDYRFGQSRITQGATALAFDIHARSIAEETRATSWRSYDGDFYMRAEPAYQVEVNALTPDLEKIWVVTPEPFKWSETAEFTGAGLRHATSPQQKWKTPGEGSWKWTKGKEYWRASTCHLYCKLPDGTINLVREGFVATPTLAEASSRIGDGKQLRNYTIAYDAYARHLAEILAIPYWTALNGDMYLRNPTRTMSMYTNIWTLASNVFDAANMQPRYEGNVKVEYWRAPAGHLFRRREGRIELYTGGRDEIAPPNAAVILATPLKFVTSSGSQTISPPARYLDKQFEDPICNQQSDESKQRPSKSASYYATPESAQTHGYKYVALHTMMTQFSDVVSRYCEDILHPPHIYHSGDAIPRDLMDTLMCLNEDEWKYLPLWAGGCDDGTGGVFNEIDVPNLEAGGFAGGKRGLGTDAIDGKVEIEGWSDVGSEAKSTLGRASKIATDGTETVKDIDSQSSASEFMRTDELWEQIRDMKGREDKLVSLQAGDREEDQGTVMGAASDIQGQLFGDIDDDKEVEHMDEDHEDEDDFEIVDDSDDAFVSVAMD